MVFLFCKGVLIINAQSCVDTVNTKQRGTNAASTNEQVIVPASIFSCNGRITGYLISLESESSQGDYPIVQVWHPINSRIYTRVDTECPLTANDISRMTAMGDEYYLGKVSCTGDNRIEFQSGDIIGHYHSNEVRYRLWNIETMGYTSYSQDHINPPPIFNISSAVNTIMQPLIQILYGEVDIGCNIC